MKYPHIQFYTGDWLKDPALSVCSLAARGMWIDLICAIHEWQNGGKLSANLQQISRLCRCTESEAEAALHELASNKAGDIYEENGAWVITCRRIQKAHELSEVRKQSGSKGAAKRKQTGHLARVHAGVRADNDIDIERVREFARGKEIIADDADWFFFKCQGNGWKNAGEPIKNWKMTLLSWQKAGYLPSQKRAALRKDPQQMTKYGMPLPDGCTIRNSDGAVLDYTGRVMDINQVRAALA